MLLHHVTTITMIQKATFVLLYSKCLVCMIVVIVMVIFVNVSVLLATPFSASATSSNNIIPDSGATSTMRHNRSDFETNYVTCNGVFLLMGDVSKIPVAGYSISRMKMDRNVTQLINSLHARDLDSNLFSATVLDMPSIGRYPCRISELWTTTKDTARQEGSR